MTKYYYGVRIGNKPGIYNTWVECQEQVKGFKGAKFKKFITKEEALNFIEGVEELETKEDYVKDISSLKDGEAVVYVDGSFSLEKMTYSYGLVLIDNKEEEYFKGKDNDKALAEMRNVSGELKGAIEAMRIALDRKFEILYLHYDYAGIEEWALGRWKTNKDGTRSYKEFYDSIKDDLKVVFIKVAAHTGVHYNEVADKLAKEALL